MERPGTPGADPVVTTDDVPMNHFLRKITLFSSGGAFLDGYVLSLIGVALTLMTPEMGLTTGWTAAIGASSLAGIFFGSLAGGFITDMIGRRLTFILDVIAIGLCSIVGALAADPMQVVISRLILGFFIGADYPIATSLISEFVPKDHRAIGMGMVSLSWYLGATLAAFVGWWLFTFDGGWRWMLASALIPCFILLAGRSDIPESPRWLMRKGRDAEADAAVLKVYGPGVTMHIPADAPRVSLRATISNAYRKRVIYLGVFILCQVVPMYAIYTFGPDILSAFGMSQGREAILGEAIISCFFIAGNIPAMFWLNSWGRRKMVIFGLSGMTVGLLALAIWPNAPITFVIVAFGVYAFASGAPGILQWLYPNELFPTEVRATAVGLAIAISRIGVVISTYGQPIFMATYGVGATMAVGAGLVIIALVWSIISAPETKGKTLEESSSLSERELQ